MSYNQQTAQRVQNTCRPDSRAGPARAGFTRAPAICDPALKAAVRALFRTIKSLGANRSADEDEEDQSLAWGELDVDLDVVLCGRNVQREQISPVVVGRRILGAAMHSRDNGDIRLGNVRDGRDVLIGTAFEVSLLRRSVKCVSLTEVPVDVKVKVAWDLICELLKMGA